MACISRCKQITKKRKPHVKFKSSSSSIDLRHQNYRLALSRRIISKAKRVLSRIGKKQTREKLHVSFDDIIRNVAIDYSNREFQDIQNAVFQLLRRVANKINERCVFKIDRVQLCGSMAEKISCWKTHPVYVPPGETQKMAYIEFDFLAVLKRLDTYSVTNTYECPLCMNVKEIPVDTITFRKYYRKPKPFASKGELNALFKKELRYGIISLCSCFSTVHPCSDSARPKETLPVNSLLQLSSVQPPQECDQCVVNMQTGRLQIATSIKPWKTRLQYYLMEPMCSIIFLWTSMNMNLFAPNINSLQRNHKMQNLPIYVDFLPVFEVCERTNSCGEFRYNYFVIPKRCNCGCAGGWRISDCLSEIDAILNRMSVKHRKAYQALKYLSTFMNHLYAQPYHLKTEVLNHSVTCSNVSNTFIDCMIAILRELGLAYERTVLKPFSREGNLLNLNVQDSENERLERRRYMKAWTNRMATALNDFKDWETFFEDVISFS